MSFEMVNEQVEPEDVPAPHFCSECGAPIHGGKFCSNCGTPSGVHQAVPAPVPTNGAHNGHDQRTSAFTPSETVPPGSPTAEHAVVSAAGPQVATRTRAGRPRWPAVVAGAVVILAAGAAAVVLLASRDQHKTASADVAYRHKVASIFGPMLGANRQVSDQLDRLHGTQPTDARAAVRNAQRQTTIALGALGALTVPASSQPLASDARQVLDRESAYLSEVSSVLSRPLTANTGSLQTLSSNLSSALDQAGPTVAGTEPTVSGADRLAAWQQATKRTLTRRAKARAQNTASAPASAGGSTGTTTNPYADGRACGDGVFAGPNTSCAFGLNVRDAHDEAPGAVASVRAFSPTTGETYTMDCAPSGDGVTCSGANDASVTF